MRSVLGLTATFFVAVCGLGAQQGSPGGAPPMRAPDGGTWERTDGIFMTPIPNVPFSATLLTESTRVMEDGGTMTRHTFAHVARDSRGRVRLEFRQMLPASVTNVEPQLITVTLIDMTAGTRMTCFTENRVCRVMTVRKGMHAPILPAGPIGHDEYLERLDLGHGQKSGQDAIGTRETLTLRTGLVGNDRPLISRKEIWYSPSLEINVSTKRESPKTGTDVLTLGDINLGEPPAEMLATPAGYRVMDERMSMDGLADQVTH